MKIGLLNPWSNAAENQLIPSITRVAEALGHTTVECKTTRDVLAQQPDLVLSMSRTQPKLTDIPTYGLVFDPRHIVIERASYIEGLLSYDGVFTIFETLREFLADLLFAVRRDAEIGYFYPTASIMEWDAPISFASARLAYFGINWDRRRPGLFALLDAQPWMDIYGPEAAWVSLKGSSYKGMVPFDGTSVLQRYRSAGVGLCLFSDSHFSDNIISSRVFEICSAGAVVIASRMPWLEQHFGDAMLYIDQNQSDAEIVEQIGQHMRWIQEHPQEAAQLAARAQRIFREQFSLEALLPNVLNFHAAQLSARAERPTPLPASLSVIVLCDSLAGDTPTADVLTRSLESVARQGYSDIDVLVAVPMSDSAAENAEYERVVQAYQDRFRSCLVVRATAPVRSSVLWSSLKNSSGELLAIMHSGDEWMSGHLASLLQTLEADGGKNVVFSGSVLHSETPFTTRGGDRENRNRENRRINPFPFLLTQTDVVFDALSIPIGSMLFRRAMLDPWIMRDPEMARLSAAYLILSLLQKEAPAFTYRATAIHYVPDVSAHPTSDPSAVEDVTRLRLRFVGRTFPPAPRLVDLDALQSVVERGETRRLQEIEQIQRHDGVTAYRVPSSFAYLVGPEDSWEPVPLRVTLEEFELAGQPASRQLGQPGDGFPLAVAPPHEPWAVGLRWRPMLPEDRPYIVRIAGRVESGTAGFAVVDGAWKQVLARVFVPSQDERVIVDLPVMHPSDVTEIVVQATLGSVPVRVVLERVELFAAHARFPLAAMKRVLAETEQFRVDQETVRHTLADEQDRLQATLHAVQRERDALGQQLTASQQRIREMRASKIWQLGTLYWRLFSRRK